MLKEMLKGSSVSREYSKILCANNVINNVEEMAEKFNYYFIGSIRQLSDTDYEKKFIEQKQYTDKEFSAFGKVKTEQLHNIVERLINKSGTKEGITQ